MPFDLISIGDPTIDTLVVIHDAEVRCELKRQENCVICIEFGDKIPVDNIEQKTAGNGMNVAVGSSRLGLQVAFHGIVGEDTPGDQIIKALKADKVNTRLVVRDKKHNTNASTVINFKGERTILVYHAPRVYKMAKLPKTRWIYYTSVGKNHGKLNSAIVDYIKNSNTKLAYNPGTFQMLAGPVAVKKVASHCEVMFVNKQEAERIFGDGGNITHLLHKMHEVGVVIPVITDGVNGSYASDGNQVWHMPMYPFTAIERTGAGDSYATGFVASLASGNDVQTAMQWGTANGASVVLNIGPQDGLLKKKDLLAFINKPKCRTIKPRTVKPSRSR